MHKIILNLFSKDVVKSVLFITQVIELSLTTCVHSCHVRRPLVGILKRHYCYENTSRCFRCFGTARVNLCSPGYFFHAIHNFLCFRKPELNQFWFVSAVMRKRTWSIRSRSRDKITRVNSSLVFKFALNRFYKTRENSREPS